MGGGGVEPRITQALNKANLLKPGQKYWAMQSEATADHGGQQATIHPDKLFGPFRNVTFLYTKDGELITGAGNHSHNAVASRVAQDRANAMRKTGYKHTGMTTLEYDLWSKITQDSIMGRCCTVLKKDDGV